MRRMIAVIRPGERPKLGRDKGWMFVRAAHDLGAVKMLSRDNYNSEYHQT